MKYLVKDTPIRKNNKTYGVGEEFPYSDKDKKLLWNLTDLSAKSSKAEDGSTKNVGTSKKPTTKKVVAKKKTDSKK